MTINATRTVRLERNVRAFTRSMSPGNALSNIGLLLLHAGETVELGESEASHYNHCVQQVAQVIGFEPPRFIILSELGPSPWHVSATDPGTHECRLYRVDDSFLSESPGMYAEVWGYPEKPIRRDQKPEGKLVQAVIAKSIDDVRRLMSKYQEENGIFEVGSVD